MKASQLIYPEPSQLDRIEAKLDMLLEMGKPKKSPKAGDSNYNPNFEAWWKIYPKKAGKKPALRTWNRIRPPVGKLIADTKNRTENDRQWIEGYVPNPQTYLNQERWNDVVNLVETRKVSLPRDDNDLQSWAQYHNLRPARVGESWGEYRSFLQGNVV